MEIKCHPSDHKRGKFFHAPALARKRPLSLAYKELKARFRGLTASSKQTIEDLRYKLDMEQMNGDCIMACRDYIEKHLGVNCAKLPGLHIGSPYFDDIVMGLVNAIKHYHGHLIRLNQNSLQAQQSANQQTLAAQQAMLSYPTATATNVYAVGTNANQIWFSTTSTPSAATITAVSGAAVGTSPTTAGIGISSPADFYLEWADVNLEIKDGQKRTVKLPDGTIIETQVDGSYTINDADAKVIYRANRVREFNRYINASDLLAQFVDFCGNEVRLNRDEMLNLPISLFIGWLILEAAKKDGEPEPSDIKLIPDLHKAAHRACLLCGTELADDRRQKNIPYCSARCFEQHEQSALMESAA